jgi:hypothetical protein
MGASSAGRARGRRFASALVLAALAMCATYAASASSFPAPSALGGADVLAAAARAGRAAGATVDASTRAVERLRDPSGRRGSDDVLDDDEDDFRDTVIPAPGHRREGEANLIVIITPTYRRPLNKAPPQANALLRVRNSLCRARGHQFLWILAVSPEDFAAQDPTSRVPKCVPGRDTSIVHNVSVVAGEKPPPPNGRTSKRRMPHRGIEQRNAGLALVRDPERFAAAIARGGFRGLGDPRALDPVIFFGDDDNEYDPGLFDEMARVRRIGTWPVGFPFAMNPLNVETVSVDSATGKIRGYTTTFCDRRRYNLDMAAFAARLSFVGDAAFSQSSRTGHAEDDFLRQMLGEDGVDRIEVMASGATQVYAWHLGWRFDPNRRWGLKTSVEQPSKVSCKSVEEQQKIVDARAKAKKRLAANAKKKKETHAASAKKTASRRGGGEGGGGEGGGAGGKANILDDDGDAIVV